jgi:hypothetical protein
MIEELLSTQRKELFANLSEVENYFVRKTENLVRAINAMAKQLKITNPLSLLST